MAKDRGVVVVEFALSNRVYPFVGLSAAESCRVALEKMLPRGSGEYAEFFSVFGADPDRVFEIAEEHDLVEPRLLGRYEDGGLFEFVVEGFCPARDLAEAGAIPREVTSEDGDGRIVAEVPPGVAAPAVIEGFLETHGTAELTAKRTKDRATPVFSRSELQAAVDERVTDRQQEVLRTAFEAGYYEPTSDTTGEQVGAALGIDPSTVSQHLKAAERELVAILFEESVFDR